MVHARLATVLALVAGALIVAGWWSRPGTPKPVTGEVVAIQRAGGGRGGVIGGRITIRTSGGLVTVHRGPDAARYQVGDQVTLTDDAGGAASTLLLTAGLVCAVGALGNGLRARWMGRLVADGWHDAAVHLVDVPVRGRVRTLAWVDGTLAEGLGLRRLGHQVEPTAPVAGNPATGKFVLANGRRWLPMKPVSRTGGREAPPAPGATSPAS
ncbi:MAG: hypothetical protein JWN29_3527 [Acidimicrobiales bacterium]|nr:hypothetical protein [Acidimicrobiales bacterium]